MNRSDETRRKRWRRSVWSFLNDRIKWCFKSATLFRFGEDQEINKLTINMKNEIIDVGLWMCAFIWEENIKKCHELREKHNEIKIKSNVKTHSSKNYHISIAICKTMDDKKIVSLSMESIILLKKAVYDTQKKKLQFFLSKTLFFAFIRASHTWLSKIIYFFQCNNGPRCIYSHFYHMT